MSVLKQSFFPSNNGKLNILGWLSQEQTKLIIIICIFSPFALAENKPRDLQITAYK